MRGRGWKIWWKEGVGRKEGGGREGAETLTTLARLGRVVGYVGEGRVCLGDEVVCEGVAEEVGSVAVAFLCGEWIGEGYEEGRAYV